MVTIDEDIHESVQHSAARLVTSDYGFTSSVTGMLKSLGCIIDSVDTPGIGNVQF